MSLNKQWTNRVKTAGVTIDGINFKLLINEEFWNKQSDFQKLALLKHEILHLAMFHLTDFDHLTDHKLANIAMDCEINQLINKTWLPDNPVLPSTFPELNLEALKGTHYYYEKLRDAKDKNMKNLVQQIKEALANGECVVKADDGTVIDISNHGLWEEIEDQLNEADKSLIKSQTEHLMKDIAEQIEKSRGTVPGELAHLLEKMKNKEAPKFDWRGYLRTFVGGSLNIYTKKLRRKFNKRFEDNPGLKIKKRRHILVGLDTSGSVSNEEIVEFFHEIDHICRTGSDVTLLQFDAAISDISVYKPSQEIKLYGRGGTDFSPAIAYYNEHYRKYTCLIMLTDGEAPAPEKARGKMLWVMSSKSSINKELHGPQIKLN